MPKFYCIEPATKDKDGVCVLPTMEEPQNSAEYYSALSFQQEIEADERLSKWGQHLRTIEKFPTSCDRVGWFEGEYGPCCRDGFECSKWEEGTCGRVYRVVPQSEEKDLAPEEKG
jgi:hypothetical protein